MEIRHLKFERLVRECGFTGAVIISKNGYNVSFTQGSVNFRVSFVDLAKYSDTQLVDLANALMDAIRREEAK